MWGERAPPTAPRAPVPWPCPGRSVWGGHVNKRTALAAAVMAVLLVPLLGVPASAHGGHKGANSTFVVGWGTEPAYAGTTNSVQLVISNNGKPVTNAKGLKAAVSTGDAQPKGRAP